MLTDQGREPISFGVRVVAAGVLVLGAAAIAVGYLPHGAVSRGGGAQWVSAGGHGFAGYLALLLLPGVAVLHRPDKARILLWVACAIPCFAALVSLSITGAPVWHAHAGTLRPLWPACATYVLVATIICSIGLVIPVLGFGHRPSNLPGARIHRV